MGVTTDREPVMRMRFELERDDNPPLFDELIKFAKGTKRLNRLRTLAHEGLLAQREWIGPIRKAEGKRTDTAGEEQRSRVDDVLTAASTELFGPALDA